LFRLIPYGAVGTILVAAILLAGRGLRDHAAAVAHAFATGGLAAARSAVAQIVGRDPATLDEAGVCRAAIESTAENFSDGVVAPLGLALAGPRRYRGVLVDDPFLNANGRRKATPDDIRRGLRVYLGAWAILTLVVALAAVPVVVFIDR